MNFIIFDLEWNSAYNHIAHQFTNEIIEIGAIKLDEHLQVVDTFKQLVIPEFTKKLSSRCKRLTKITNEEIKEYGIPFTQAFRDFARWSQGDNNVFLSWSNSDLFVLALDFLAHTGSSRVAFIHQYCDAQQYCMAFIKRDEAHKNNQIGLANCAAYFDIEVDTDTLHRALSDCYITAECFKKVYEKERFMPYVRQCDTAFFERLLYKPYYITEPQQDAFNVYETKLICPKCKAKMAVPENLTVQNKAFKGAVKCGQCHAPYWIFIRAKKNYDNVAIKVGYVDMNKKRARKLRDQM